MAVEYEEEQTWSTQSATINEKTTPCIMRSMKHQKLKKAKVRDPNPKRSPKERVHQGQLHPDLPTWSNMPGHKTPSLIPETLIWNQDTKSQIFASPGPKFEIQRTHYSIVEPLMCCFQHNCCPKAHEHLGLPSTLQSAKRRPDDGSEVDEEDRAHPLLGTLSQSVRQQVHLG